MTKRDEPPKQPIMFAHEGPLKGSNWEITSAMTIGRDAGCDISDPKTGRCRGIMRKLKPGMTARYSSLIWTARMEPLSMGSESTRKYAIE